MQKIVIRADASLQIGSGHIMRCLTLANVLRERGANVSFICRQHQGNLINVVENQGFTVYTLTSQSNHDILPTYAHSAWLGVNEQTDIDECQPILQQIQPDWLIIDHYAIGKLWQQQAKKQLPMIKILVIDDLADREHDCELLLDQTLSRKVPHYQKLIPKNCRLLLGARYALLRPEFTHWRNRQSVQKSEIPNILLNLGGVDKDNLTLKILQLLTNYQSQYNQHFSVTVVLGKTAPHIESVQNFAKNANFTCQVLVNVNNMAELMSQANLAIGAGGSTSWERCCLGLPTLLLVLADNQRYVAQMLAKKHAVIVLDDWQNFDKCFNDLLQNQQLIRENAQQLVDGQGAIRVVNHLMLANWQNAKIRRLNKGDSYQTWQWRNDWQIRQFMFNQDEILWENHQIWLNKQLKSNDVTLLIFEIDNQPCGVVNFRLTMPKTPTNTDFSLDWGFYLSPTTPKGQGLGFLLGVLAIGQLLNGYWHKDLPNKIYAQVLAHNHASLALHQKLGFEQIPAPQPSEGLAKQDDVIHFVLHTDKFLY